VKPMKAYVTVTGVLFALITLAHFWRMIYTEQHLAADPWYLLLTALAGGLALWAAKLVWRA
jgi:hypothetical protein